MEMEEAPSDESLSYLTYVGPCRELLSIHLLEKESRAQKQHLS